MIDAQTSAATWRIRRATRSRRFIGNLTAWSAGLVVNQNDYVQSYGLAWRAANSGTTAGTAGPDNSSGASFTDGGGVTWFHVALLLAQPAAI